MATSSLLRTREHGHAKVTMVELFFDLVFVFAVTQLSHGLLGKLTIVGALETLFLFLAVWWLWIFTSWITNWLDPDKPPVRMMVIALMFGGLLLSTSLPDAFGDKSAIFGGSFAAMQLGRSLFMVYALRRHGGARLKNFVRISIWLATSGALWVAGGLGSLEVRWVCWLAALAIEYVGPAAYFFVPGLGRSHTSDWDIDGAHMAERCGLFVIIALGESIIVTGATFAELPLDVTNLISFAIALFGSVAMWWVYFDSGAERAAHRIVHSDDPGRQGRIAYTYIHLLIIAGVIVCAVADELMLAHPDHATTAGIVAMLGGPALYLLGNALFKWVMNDRKIPPLSHMVGLVLLGAIAPLAFGHVLSAQAIGGATFAVFVFVAVWETVALRRGAPTPSPHPQS